MHGLLLLDGDEQALDRLVDGVGAARADEVAGLLDLGDVLGRLDHVKVALDDVAELGGALHGLFVVAARVEGVDPGDEVPERLDVLTRREGRFQVLPVELHGAVHPLLDRAALRGDEQVAQEHTQHRQYRVHQHDHLHQVIVLALDGGGQTPLRTGASHTEASQS